MPVPGSQETRLRAKVAELSLARALLGRHPAVAGVGLGLSEAGRGLVWRAYVRGPLAETAAALPQRLLGLLVEVLAIRETRPAAGPTYVPSMQITNETNETGSLGCFVKVGSVPGILSAAHVIFANKADPVPPATGLYHDHASTSTCCGSSGPRIATTVNKWLDGFKPAPGASGFYETECALALLDKGVSYANTIPQVGSIAGSAALTAAQLPADMTLIPQDNQILRMFSATNGGLRFGILFRFTTGANDPPSPLSKGPFQDNSDATMQILPMVNQLLVMPVLPPIPGEAQADYAKRYRALVSRGDKLTFSEHGDSGSVVVDKDSKVVGLVSRGQPVIDFINAFKAAGKPVPDPLAATRNMGVVTPIGAVLALMGVTIPNAYKGTAPARGGIGEIAGPGMGNDFGLDPAAEALRRRLVESPRGRFAAAKIGEHRAEARRIVLTVRRATVTWHRLQGPAFVRHCIRNLRDPAHRVPTLINGVGRVAFLEALAELMIAYGGESLRRDVVAHRAFVIAALADLTSLHELPGRLRVAPRLAASAATPVPAEAAE